MILFEQQDAVNARVLAEENGWTDGLKSFKKGAKRVTIGDAIRLLLRAVGDKVDDDIVEMALVG
jgi:hypothetical protein